MRKSGLKIFTLLAVFLLMSVTFHGTESKLVLNPYYSMAGATAQGSTSRIRLLDTDYSHYLALMWNENRTANQTLNFITGAGDRTVTLSGDLTVESASLVNQDLTSDASPSFGGLGLTGNLTLAANSITGTSVDINNAEMQQLSNIGANTIAAADWTTLAGISPEIDALTDAEVQQLQNIGTKTISNTQWGYLGAMNQGVTTTSNVSFGTIASADITVDSKLVLSAGSITDVDGAISFGNENLSTTGTFDVGGLLTRNAAAAKFYSTEAGKTDWRFTLYTADADCMKFYAYDDGEATYVPFNIGTSDPSKGITFNANGTITVNLASTIASGSTIGNITLADGSITDSSGAISFGDEDLSTTGNIFINETANAKMTTGLTINQGAAGDDILALKGAGVAHGCTNFAETDTFMSIRQWVQGAGCAGIRAFSEFREAWYVEANYTTNDTAKDESARAPVTFDIYKISGVARSGADADANLVVIKNGALTRFIFDEDGDMFYDGAAPANYDAFDDAAACFDVQRVLYNLDKPKERQLMDFKKYTASELIDMGVISDGGFVSTKRMNALILGAVGQLDDEGKAQAQRIDELESQVTQLQAMVEAQAQQLQEALALLASRQEWVQ